MSSVLVVGRGVIGLTSALLLRRAGHSVRCIGDPRRRPSSLSACALYLPYFGVAPSEDLVNWSRRGWAAFQGLLTRPEAGVSVVRMLECFRDVAEPPETLSLCTPVTAGSRDDLPDPFTFAWEFDTFLVDMTRYLGFLEGECYDLGIVLEEDPWDPAASSEVEDVVVDCMGHWASTAFPHLEVVPVRGQLVVISGVTVDIALGGDEYLIAPRSDGCIVGSLWQVGEEEDSPRDADTDELMEVYRRWVRSRVLSGARREAGGSIASLSGARPFRAAGPLVALDLKPRATPLVHNVGHGGSGVALSWGCAEEVVRLVARVAPAEEPGGR